MCAESETLGVLSIGTKLFDVRVLCFLDFVQELFDELGAAEVLFRFPGIVVAAPAFPVDFKLSCSILFIANIDDFVDF